MIKHMVLFSFKDNFSQTEIDNLFLQLEKLTESISEIYSFSYGKNNSPEGINKNFNYGMVMDFESEKVREFYLHHEEHVKIVNELITPNLKDKSNSVLVLDYSF